MIQWDVTGSGVSAFDAADTEVQIRAPDWETAGDPHVLPRLTDAKTTGTTTQFSVPAAAGTLAAANAGTAVLLERGERRQVADREFVLEVDAGIDVIAGFSGPAVVSFDDRLRVRFDEPTRVTLGFQSDARAPPATITIPKTLDGIATAVTHAASALRTTTPARSNPALRDHPPAFAFGDAVDVPPAVAASTPDTGIELVVPRSLRALFVAAPLAYYLGADLTVDAGVTPRLRAPDANVTHAFDRLETESPELLARVFWLDCLVRAAASQWNPQLPQVETFDATHLEEIGVLEELAVDPDSAYAASPSGRLATYLDVPFGKVADDLPDWHLSMHVAPNLDHVGTLPFLLDRLACIHPPETATLESKELMERSLDDFYRGPPGPVASVEMLKPKLRDGRWQGWLAEGTPIDVFKSHPAAYRNHLDYLRHPTEELSVAVVLNDRSMTGEHDAVTDLYEAHADTLPMAVSFHENLTRQELAALLGDHHEFVHYIGHCEVEGLRCADGNLAVSDVPSTNVETFFLNACGSYYEGLNLVKQGSVAGAVTLRKVLDEQAAKVGTAFARLLVNGFPIETALRLARRRIRMGKDYAVVGDGMQTLSQTDDDRAHVAHVERRHDGECHVEYEHLAVDAHGCWYDLEMAPSSPPRLSGNSTTFTRPSSALADVFADADHPVIVDGEFYWSDEAASLLRDSVSALK